MRDHRLLFRRNGNIESDDQDFEEEQNPCHRHHQHWGQHGSPACGLRAQDQHKGKTLFKNRHLLHRQCHRLPAGCALFLHLCARLRCQPAAADQHFQDDRSRQILHRGYHQGRGSRSGIMIYKAVSIKKAKINMDFFTFFSQMEPIIKTSQSNNLFNLFLFFTPPM